eukprot:15332031-Ditylum_brightwellii.AAC.1
MASSLQHAALQATHTTMAKRTRRGNSNKEEESRNAKKLEWLVAEQKKVVQVDEKALIQAAVVTRRKRLSCVAAERSGQVDAALDVDEREVVVEKEDGNVVNTNTQEVMTIKNAHVDDHPTMNYNLSSTAAQDINDERKEDAAPLARTDKQEAVSKDDDDDETIKNADIDATTTSKTRTAAQDPPPPPPSLKKKIPLSSQEVYDISADDVREKEAADRSGEWILQQIEEEEEKEGEHMKKKQNKDTSPETNSKQ